MFVYRLTSVFTESVCDSIGDAFSLFGIEEKGDCGVGCNSADGKSSQKILFEEDRYIGIGGESVAIENVDNPRVGFIVDGIGECTECKVGGGRV